MVQKSRAFGLCFFYFALRIAGGAVPDSAFPNFISGCAEADLLGTLGRETFSVRVVPAKKGDLSYAVALSGLELLRVRRAGSRVVIPSGTSDLGMVFNCSLLRPLNGHGASRRKEAVRVAL